MKPLVLLDVDGVLNPFGAAWSFEDDPAATAASHGFALHRLTTGSWSGTVALATWHGRVLRDIAESADIVWATTWNEDANAKIGPLLGLPLLPVLHLEPGWDDALFWKVPQIAQWLAENHPGRDWIWLDDGVVNSDAAAVRGLDSRVGPGVTYWVDPVVGLTARDFDLVWDWLAGTGQACPPSPRLTSSSPTHTTPRSVRSDS